MTHIKAAMQACGVANVEERPTFRLVMKDGSIEVIHFRPVYGVNGHTHHVERNGVITGLLTSGYVPNKTAAVLELHKLLKKEKHAKEKEAGPGAI